MIETLFFEIFNLGLFISVIINFIYLIEQIKDMFKHGKQKWYYFFVLSIGDIALESILFYIFYRQKYIHQMIDSLSLQIGFYFCIFLQIIILVIGLIFYIIKKIKFKNEKIELSKKKLKLIILVQLSIFIFFIFAHEVIFRYKKYNIEKTRESVINTTIEYLNNKYGVGDYQVVDYQGKFDCSLCIPFTDDYDYYTLTLKSKYLQDNFEIDATIPEAEITDKYFLSKYFSEKYNIRNLDDYVFNLKYKDSIEQLDKNYEAKLALAHKRINLDNVYFHKIPSLDELKKYLITNDYCFEINKSVIDNSEQINYLKELSKEIIKQFNEKNQKQKKYEFYFKGSGEDCWNTKNYILIDNDKEKIEIVLSEQKIQINFEDL